MHTWRCKVRCADDNCRTRCWDGQKTKLPPPAETLKWTSLAQLQRWILNSFAKLALQSKKRSCSVATQLSLYSNLKVSVYLKLKYTRVFKHKRIHNCVTHSTVSRNIMAADAATFHNYGRLLNNTQYAVCTFKMMYCVLHAVATTPILDSFDDC